MVSSAPGAFEPTGRTQKTIGTLSRGRVHPEPSQAPCPWCPWHPPSQAALPRAAGRGQCTSPFGTWDAHLAENGGSTRGSPGRRELRPRDRGEAPQGAGAQSQRPEGAARPPTRTRAQPQSGRSQCPWGPFRARIARTGSGTREGRAGEARLRAGGRQEANRKAGRVRPHGQSVTALRVTAASLSAGRTWPTRRSGRPHTHPPRTWSPVSWTPGEHTPRKTHASRTGEGSELRTVEPR